MSHTVLALDIGGSSIKHALVSDGCVLREQGKEPAPRDTKEHFLGVVEALWNIYKDRADGLAISMAGKLDPADGLIVSAGSFPALTGERLIPLLEGRCGCSAAVENDGTCAGLAEFHHGALKDYNSALCVVLGTGIGAALFLDGKIWRGSHLCGPELSLVRADGQAGLMHSWMFCGGATGLVNMAKKALESDEDIDGIEIFRLADEGDERILSMLDEYAQIAAVQLYNLQAILDVEAIAIGGGISAASLLMNLIQEKLQAIFDAEAHHNLPPRMPALVPCEFRNDANLIGAWEHYNNTHR
jgi:predicted NBD/HSP70 family sugar kinase